MWWIKWIKEYNLETFPCVTCPISTKHHTNMWSIQHWEVGFLFDLIYCTLDIPLSMKEYLIQTNANHGFATFVLGYKQWTLPPACSLHVQAFGGFLRTSARLATTLAMCSGCAIIRAWASAGTTRLWSSGRQVPEPLLRWKASFPILALSCWPSGKFAWQSA